MTISIRDRILINRRCNHGAIGIVTYAGKPINNPTMWTEEEQEKERIRSYFGATLRRATSLIQLTIQKIGSDPSLDDVTAILDVRSGLQGAYNDMEAKNTPVKRQ